MEILIFGGTSEGRELAERLAETGERVTLSVVSDYGRDLVEEKTGLKVLTGPLPAEDIFKLLPAFELVIDATHPYARHISATLREVCARTGKELLRLVRESSEEDREGQIRVPDLDAAVEALKTIEGNILITTGAKEIGKYACLGPDRLIARVLPSVRSLEACREAGIPMKNVICAQGPFSARMNEAVIREYGAAALVTKDSGEAGGFPEKIEAAGRCGIPAVVIDRPREEGYSMEEILDFIEERGRT